MNFRHDSTFSINRAWRNSYLHSFSLKLNDWLWEYFEISNYFGNIQVYSVSSNYDYEQVFSLDYAEGSNEKYWKNWNRNSYEWLVRIYIIIGLPHVRSIIIISSIHHLRLPLKDSSGWHYKVRKLVSDSDGSSWIFKKKFRIGRIC